MTRRYEFSKQTKREALRRSEMSCEAMGAVYGLEPGQRCNAPLGHGVQFDHYPAPATDPGSDTLDNCAAVCLTCHKFKTRTYDTPMQAKGKRVRDRHIGIRKPRSITRWRRFDGSIVEATRERYSHSLIRHAGIALPPMYAMGFRNNNCIPCVKATSPNYWALVRQQFPAEFERMVKLSRELGVRLCRINNERRFIDEIPADWPTTSPIQPSCDFLCHIAEQELEQVES